LAAFFVFHSSAQTFILDCDAAGVVACALACSIFCATAGAAENPAAAQTAAAQIAASPDFIEHLPWVNDRSMQLTGRAPDKPIAPPSQAKVVCD
jgi:hypothetical protein